MTDRTAAKRVAALRQRERDAGKVRVTIVIPEERETELRAIVAAWLAAHSGAENNRG